MEEPPPRRAPALPAGEVTRLLQAWSQGDPRAADQLMPMVYAELRRRAAAYLRREGRPPSLCPSDLVHEAYLRLRTQNAAWQNRNHCFALAANLMRRVLIDHARAAQMAKRRRSLCVTLNEGLTAAAPPPGVDLLALDEALQELAARRPPGAAGRAALLRRPVPGGGGAGAGRFPVHRQSGMGDGQGLAPPPAGRRELTCRGRPGRA